MVERRVCSFCGAEMEPGTGKMYVKRDGTVLSFDTNKCYKNMVELGRIPRTTTWTRAAKREKDIAKAAVATKGAAPAEAKAESTKTKARQPRGRKKPAAAKKAAVEEAADVKKAAPAEKAAVEKAADAAKKE